MSLATLFAGSVATRDEDAERAQRAAVPEEILVDGTSVAKGMRVGLSEAFVAEIQEIGGSHPHHHLLEQAEGTVVSIGVDRTACMVQFGAKNTHKLLIGRGGAFQLKICEKHPAARSQGNHLRDEKSALQDADTDPRLMSLGITWHQTKDGEIAARALEVGRAALKCGSIAAGDVLLSIEDKAAAATVEQVERMLKEVLLRKPSVVLKFRRQRSCAGGLFKENVVVQVILDEWIVDGSSVYKGASVALSSGYSTRINIAGDTHQHYKIYMLNAKGVVVTIGMDKQACMVDFGPPIGIQKMLIGRPGADGFRCFSLIHAWPSSVDDSCGSGEILPPLVSTALGLELSQDDNKHIVVAKVFPEGPAGRDGRIQSGDILLQVGDRQARVPVCELRMPSKRLNGNSLDMDSICLVLGRTTIFSGLDRLSLSINWPRKAPAGRSACCQEKIVDGRSLCKGTLVCLSNSYQDYLRGLHTDSHGVAHSTNAHSVLLGASGKVVAIGADREACMVDFGPHGIHKMLVGRKGAFQLQEQEDRLQDGTAPLPANESEDPGVDEHKIKSGQTWQEGLAMTLMSNILASSGATSEVDMQHCHHAKPDSTAPVDVAQAKGEPEHLVTGQDLAKGSRVTFSEDYAAIIRMTGQAHLHFHLLGSIGVVTAIGADREACHVSWPAAPSNKAEKYLIGREGQFQLAYVQGQCMARQGGEKENGGILRLLHDKSASPAATVEGDLDRSTELESHILAGLGIMVNQREGGVVIGGLIEGSAAAAVGPYLRVGDTILSVDGKRVEHTAEFMRLARGPPGSAKRLEVCRLRGRDTAAIGSRASEIIGHARGGQLIFMMSLVIGRPGAHTLVGQIRDAEGTGLAGAAQFVSHAGARAEETSPILAPPRTPACSPGPDASEGMDEKDYCLPAVGNDNFRALPLPPAPELSPASRPHKVVQAWIPELSSPPQVHVQPAFTTTASPQVSQAIAPDCAQLEADCSTPSVPRIDIDRSLSPDQLLADMDFDRLEVMHPPIGTGSYKTVYKALLDGSSPVAALSVSKQSARSALAEVAILQRVKAHPNLPVLFGVTRDASGGVWLVQEYFPLGGLDVQLEVWDEQLSLQSRLCILQQVCEAMLFLRLQGVMHRDLSTRNVLVHSLHEDQVLEVWVKVSDFGLSCLADSSLESIAVRRDSGDLVIPWRWTAPEVFIEECWYWKSDVWSFGVTMWEVFSFAAVPFVELSDQEVQQAVFTHGQRLPVPDACPAPVYELMQACWQAEAMARPSWTEIGITLQVLHEDPAQILI